MQTPKCILILQKHVTEMAPFDFQIFKTAWDIRLSQAISMVKPGTTTTLYNVIVWLYIEMYDTVETTFRAHLYLEDTTYLAELLYINSSFYSQKSLQKQNKKPSQS